MEFLDLIQWPAMLVTVFAAWLIGAQSKRKRSTGFWLSFAGTVLWVMWGWHSHAYALVFMQFCLAAMNIRGVFKNEPDSASENAAV